VSFDCLLSYFIGNISAKKYQNPFTCVTAIASQRWERFKTRCIYKCSAVAEMGDRLATIDMGRKQGSCCTPPFFRGSHVTQCRLSRGLPPYQVASQSIQPFDHNRHGPKLGSCVPFGEGELGPHLTQCGRSRGLPQCRVSS